MLQMSSWSCGVRFACCTLVCLVTQLVTLPVRTSLQTQPQLRPSSPPSCRRLVCVEQLQFQAGAAEVCFAYCTCTEQLRLSSCCSVLHCATDTCKAMFSRYTPAKQGPPLHTSATRFVARRALQVSKSSVLTSHHKNENRELCFVLLVVGSLVLRTLLFFFRVGRQGPKFFFSYLLSMAMWFFPLLRRCPHFAWADSDESPFPLARRRWRRRRSSGRRSPRPRR